MARKPAGTPAPDIHPDEEPTGVTIGQDEIAAGIEEPPEPDEQPANPPALTFGRALAALPDEQTGTLPPQLGELLELPDGNYRIYSLQRRPADLVRNQPPEIAIHARLERRARR